MAIALRQSTASQEIPLGPFVVGASDLVTAVTGLSIANTDIKIWKNGATTFANKNSGGATEIALGRYYCVLDATDTDTLGPLSVETHITASALPTKTECVVLSANAYDSLVAASDNLNVEVASVAANAIAAAGINSDVWTELLATTVDGVAISSIFETMLAFMAGKATYSSGTISYYKQNGSTIKLTVVASETDGSRAATGSLDP